MLNKTEKSQYTLFFSPLAKQESPLEVVRKTIEGLIAYNQTFKIRVQTAKSEELVEILLSAYYGVNNLPPLKKNLSEFTKELEINKKRAILHIDKEIENYEKISKQIDHGDYDLIYLSIYIIYELAVNSLKSNLLITTEQILAKFLEPRLVKKQSQKITQMILKGNEEVPIIAEFNTLKELLIVLKPKISSYCTLYTQSGSISWIGNSYDFAQFVLNHEVKWKMDQSRKMMIDLIHQQDNPQVYLCIVALDDFCKNIQDYSKSQILEIVGKLGFSPDEFILIELYIDRLFARAAINNFKPSDLFSSFLNFYPTITLWFQIEEKTQLFKLHSEKQKLNILKINNPKLKDEKQDLQKMSKEKLQKVEAEKIIVGITDELRPSINPQLIATPEDSDVSNVLIDSKIPQIKLDDETPLNPVVQNKEDNVIKSADPVKKVLVEFESNDESYETSTKLYKKQAIDVLSESAMPRNLLKLEGNHLDTFLKVFNLIPYTSIGLRPLINLLTTHFGGKMDTSKGNRCCIKINNIYAFIIVPQEPLEKACNSATISMHGGGHRSTRSQNNDRGSAPQYLIDQCRDALTRAGLTPVNLGLDVKIEPTMTTDVRVSKP